MPLHGRAQARILSSSWAHPAGCIRSSSPSIRLPEMIEFGNGVGEVEGSGDGCEEGFEGRRVGFLVHDRSFFFFFFSLLEKRLRAFQGRVDR